MTTALPDNTPDEPPDNWICAVRPPRGQVVHLHSPGYQPGVKPRPQANRSALCGHPIWPNGDPPRQYVLTPLHTALTWTALKPASADDPRPAWKWCPACIGHAVTIVGIAHTVLAVVVDRRTTTSRPTP